MSRFSLDYLLDSMLTLDDAQFATRHLCTKNEARQFIEGGIVPESWRSTRAMLFRMAGAVAIAEAMKPEVTDETADCAPEGTYHDHDHDADWPAECEVCRGPIRQGFGNFCSDAHRKIMMGEPSVTEQMADL